MKRDLASYGSRSRLGRASALVLAGAVASAVCLPVSAADRVVDGASARLLSASRMADREPADREHLTRRSAPDRTPSFYGGALLPHLAKRLERHRDHTPRLPHPGEEWLEHLAWQRMSDDVQRDFEKATKKAVRDHLLENTRLRDVIDGLERRAKRGSDRGGQGTAATEPGGAEPPAQRREKRGVDFDLGFHGAKPEVEMKYSLHRGDVRLNLGVSGDVDLRYRHAAIGTTEVRAVFHENDRSYRVLASFGF